MIIPQLNVFDWLLVGSLFTTIILGILHEFAGIQAYVHGKTLGIFKNDYWIPETEKQRTLLGVFFMITFPWLQSNILTLGLLLIKNPIGYWLGIIGIIFTIPQYLLLIKYVNWNIAAKSVFGLQFIAFLLWTVNEFYFV